MWRPSPFLPRQQGKIILRIHLSSWKWIDREHMMKIAVFPFWAGKKLNLIPLGQSWLSILALYFLINIGYYASFLQKYGIIKKYSKKSLDGHVPVLNLYRNFYILHSIFHISSGIQGIDN